MVNAHDIHALAGPYAMDGLPEDERHLFEAHLQVCEPCRQEVRGLIETATRLGTAAAESPPPRLHDAVMREIDRTAQIPPHVDELAARRRRPRWSTRTASWAAAACLVVALASGAVAIRAQHQANRIGDQQARVAAVLSAPDARSVTSAATPYGRGVMISSKSRDRLVFSLAGAAPLPSSKAYELWTVPDGGEPRPAGLIADDQTVLSGTIGNARKVAVTVEPAGGSERPTTKPIMAMKLA